MITLSLIMCACSIGSCTIKFEPNGGNGHFPDLYFTPYETVSSLPEPYKASFNFEGWYSDENLTKKVYTPFQATDMILYAKYTIDENWYSASDKNVEVSGGTTKKLITFTQTGIHTIMLKQQGSFFKFTSVKVENDYENNSTFDCIDLKVKDVYGFDIKDGYFEANEWQPETPMDSTEGLFLIEFIIFINSS